MRAPAVLAPVEAPLAGARRVQPVEALLVRPVEGLAARQVGVRQVGVRQVGARQVGARRERKPERAALVQRARAALSAWEPQEGSVAQAARYAHSQGAEGEGG